MRLEEIAGLQHHDRPAEPAERLPRLEARREPGASHRDLGAELVVALWGDIRLRRGIRHQPVDRALRHRAFLDQPLDAVEEPDEALRPGIHDARGLEDGQQVRRALQRLLGAFDEPPQEDCEVGLVPGQGGLVRRLARHGEDRALDGLVQRLLQPVDPQLDRLREVSSAGGEAVAQSLAQAEQELREQHSRVAPRPTHARLGHRFRDLREGRGRGVPEVAQSLRDLAEGEGEVRAGIAVRDGEDIQAVQLVPSRGHPVRRREQRATEARAVHVPDAGAPGHGRPAIPSPR